MPDTSQPAGKSRTARGSAPPWLRFASVCVLLIAVPVSLYLFLYQRTRLDQATIRNFRALDAAAYRVDQVLIYLSRVVSSSAFGISPAMLDEVTERLAGNRAACGSDPGFTHEPWQDPSRDPSWPDDLLHSRRTTPAERLAFRYWVAAHTLFESNEKTNDRATEKLWNHLHCLIDTHRRFSRPAETVTANVAPLPRASRLPPDPACAYRADARCRRLRELLDAQPCGVPSSRLTAGANGMAAIVADCRPFRERHRELYKALEKFPGHDAVIRALDLFGTESAADLDELMGEATGYLSRFFDSHLIAAADGLILFEADAAATPDMEVDESQVETPAFSSFVNISELLRTESARSNGPAAADAGDGGNGRAPMSAPSFRGRSFVRIVGGEDIGLRVFVHPFILDNVGVSDGSQEEPRAGPAASNAAARAARPTFYLVGIVDDQEFRSAAIRLRLGWVANAALGLLGLLTLTPLLWFWTAGDRLVVGRLALIGICALPVVGVVLFTVLVCGVVANRFDEHALDGALEQVSQRIVDLFDLELNGEIQKLAAAIPRLLAEARREEPPRSQGGEALLTAQTGQEEPSRRRGGELTPLEKALYCDDADRNLDYDPGKPEDWSAFVLDAEGKQRACLSDKDRARPARTPALDLVFRRYFVHPKEGALWRSPPPVQPRPTPCRVVGMQDRESLIPCLVERLFSSTDTPPALAAAATRPYFLERIDSVVGGTVQTTLAVNTERTAMPVAAAGVPLNVLDWAVPPPHVDFAVVEQETGRTLFHSDKALAMTTNFVDDAGRDPALLALLGSGARDTIDLVYAGVPVSAHVRPLRSGLPWTLVVYRGHELEDRLGGLTAALSILSALLWPVLVALPAGLALLLARWCRPEHRCSLGRWCRLTRCCKPELAGIPATLGRVMNAGSRLPWLTAASTFLYSAWLARHAWIVGGTQPILPFLLVGSVLTVAALVVCCNIRQRPALAGGGDDDDDNDDDDDHTLRRVLGLAAVITALAVAPTVLWFGYQRAALAVGLNDYTVADLVDRTLASVERAREDYRLDALKWHGAPAAPVGDRRRSPSERKSLPDAGWVQRALRPIVASSELANHLMIRAVPSGVANRAPADHVVSLHDVMSRTFGYRIGPPLWKLSESGSWQFFFTVVLVVLFLTLLIAAIAYSVCAACTIVRSRRHSLTTLPKAEKELSPLQKHPRPAPDAASRLQTAPAARGPLRAIVVHRGKRDCRRAVQERTKRLIRLPANVQWTAGALSGVVHCELGREARKTLYVVYDLQRVLEHGADGRVLLDELERAVNGEAHVLIWSRVVPDYRYSDRFERDDRWFDRGRPDDADRRDRWSSLASKFRTFGLDCSSLPDECSDVRGTDVTEHRKSAASCFDRIWTESTHDERLQLYALARGGAVNARRTAALSSLVNRGLVEADSETGVVDLRCEAFREFIEHDVDHGELKAWRKQGGGVWGFIWPPLAIGGALGLAFLLLANPEMSTTLLATLVALLPMVLPLLGGRGAGSTGAGPEGG